MNKSPTKFYFIAGIFLIYVGLKNLHSFTILYNGVALVFGIGSLILGLISYRNDKRN